MLLKKDSQAADRGKPADTDRIIFNSNARIYHALINTKNLQRSYKHPAVS
jgi:hypothetical protein